MVIAEVMRKQPAEAGTWTVPLTDRVAPPDWL